MPPPVWSRDGKYLCYVSAEGVVTRIELATLRKDRLRIEADYILTVNGRTVNATEIAYCKNHVTPRSYKAGRRVETLVIWSVYDPEYGESRVLVYKRGALNNMIVSPSGRFILAVSTLPATWYGMPASTHDAVLIDTMVHKNSRSVSRHVPDGYYFYATSLSTPKREQ